MTPTRPRLLVIGARGFLGGHLMALASARFECLPASRGTPDRSVDITDRDAVREIFERTRPHVVVLTAALSDIDECERQPVVAHRVNVVGAGNVARAASLVGARMVFTSSGAVFDGESEEYTEDSPTSPLSVYGKTKAEAERAVGEESPGAIIVRLSLVLGAGLCAGTNSWLDKMHARLEVATPSMWRLPQPGFWMSPLPPTPAASSIWVRRMPCRATKSRGVWRPPGDIRESW
jgi:dTDP-4-dehydrorhamnose reductase